MQQIIVDFGTVEILGWELPLRVYGYGLMLVLGFLVSIYVAQRRARRAGENPEHMARVGLLSLLGGIVGSRAAYVVEHWDRQFADSANRLGAILNVTSGGLVYYGGVILATAMVLAYLLAKHLPIRRYLDMVAVSLMIGLAFGRVGCTLNGCCYGARCREDWALGMRFPMFSRPLWKLDGRENPFSQDTRAPGPVYSHQLSRCRISPPAPLVKAAREGEVRVDGAFRDFKEVHAPRYLHGRLSTDQTVLWADPNDEPAARQAFYALAGADRLLDEEEWRRGLKAGGGFLRGSEHWDEAIVSDVDRSGRLTFEEAWQYLLERRRRFDADRDGRLSAPERAAANRLLQADQFQLAAAALSLPVKPAQVLGVINALLLAGLLWWFYRLRRREGQVFALLVVLYPITRFVLEIVRDDNAHDILAAVFTHNQYTSMALTTIGIVMWLSLRLLPASAGPAWADRRPAAAPVRSRRKHR
jgi:prolipoprotein diacylglyceryltransferase